MEVGAGERGVPAGFYWLVSYRQHCNEVGRSSVAPEESCPEERTAGQDSCNGRQPGFRDRSERARRALWTRRAGKRGSTEAWSGCGRWARTLRSRGAARLSSGRDDGHCCVGRAGRCDWGYPLAIGCILELCTTHVYGHDTWAGPGIGESWGAEGAGERHRERLAMGWHGERVCTRSVTRGDVASETVTSPWGF